MSRLNRFFFAGAHCPGDILQLDAERSNYLCRVLRMREQEELDIFDGEGGIYRCRVSKAHQRRAQIRVVGQIVSIERTDQAPSLAMALLKGRAMDRAIAQATELGVQQIWLLQTDRSNLPLKGARLDQKIGHWRRVIASACEQCGQTWLPVLHPPRTVKACIDEQANGIPIVFDLGGAPLPRKADIHKPLIFVGPEGGWSEEEAKFFRDQDVASYRLGDTVLRAETMPAVAMALVQHLIGWPA
ncbi:MAG: RsmE family RNA methyltransferase [Pseudomonadota bacterium]|nr:RsmE family RNA methyltransferase [Pseudomonadota bacterium]